MAGRSVTAVMERSQRHTPILLTVDEARIAFIQSALLCLRGAHCSPRQLSAVLRGDLNRRLRKADADLARKHRQCLDKLERAGFGWVLGEELEGLISALGLDEGRCINLDVIEAQLPQDTGERISTS